MLEQCPVLVRTRLLHCRFVTRASRAFCAQVELDTRGDSNAGFGFKCRAGWAYALRKDVSELDSSCHHTVLRQHSRFGHGFSGEYPISEQVIGKYPDLSSIDRAWSVLLDPRVPRVRKPTRDPRKELLLKTPLVTFHLGSTPLPRSSGECHLYSGREPVISTLVENLSSLLWSGTCHPYSGREPVISTLVGNLSTLQLGPLV
ncbi:hypothetical protein F511_23387 [Dorcoceras hygrometricum]|uniref:Uncharacterized protein n=1 Tax=Dorcoceras hygrometricum TaxID=472368 RepID=A0A2Z7APY5_9LAMI|nr:hypothetical protein F511_23387 [Dorcoceras hygrometricum]